MKQFLDFHLDFFTWWAITMEMELKSLFLTTFLWSHLSNYLHIVTLGDPETSVLLPLPRRAWFQFLLDSAQQRPPGLPYGRALPAKRWDSCSFPQSISEKALTGGKDSGNGTNVKERASCSSGRVLPVPCLDPACLGLSRKGTRRWSRQRHEIRSAKMTFQGDPGTQGPKLSFGAGGYCGHGGSRSICEFTPPST